MDHNRKPNCKCKVCGKGIYVRPGRLLNGKHGFTCCREHSAILRSEFMKGEGNHQWNLTGENNSSFKSSRRISNHGYVLINVPGYPIKGKVNERGKVTWVREHRRVIELNYQLFPSYLFYKINGWIILKECFDVHHKNGDKKDNRIENLEVMTRSNHSSLHIKDKIIIRNNRNGRIVGVIKRGELLGSPEEGNQQPSQISNDLKGSTTNRRVLRGQ